MKLSLRSLLFDLIFLENCPICKGKSYWEIAPFCLNCWERIKPLKSQKIKSGYFNKYFWKYIDILYSYSNYEGPLKEMIHYFKYHKIMRLGRQLGKLLCKIEKPSVDVIIPVPLHYKKLRSREFNQSAILAKELSKAWRIPVDFDCLIKIKNTQEQASLNKSEREKNIKDAFFIEKTLENKKVALVDDVITTGSTLLECAKALKRHGKVREVCAITLARAN